MIRLAGILAVLLVGGLPALMLPDVRMLEVSAVVWAICMLALLLPSLGLAVLGSIVALLAFSASMLIAASGSVTEAVLMGIAILVLLDCTYFEQRLRAATVQPPVAASHLSQTAVFVLLAVAGALAIGLLALIFSPDLDATTRSFIAGAGIVLLLGSMMRKASV